MELLSIDFNDKIPVYLNTDGKSPGIEVTSYYVISGNGISLYTTKNGLIQVCPIREEESIKMLANYDSSKPMVLHEKIPYALNYEIYSLFRYADQERVSKPIVALIMFNPEFSLYNFECMTQSELSASDFQTTFPSNPQIESMINDGWLIVAVMFNNKCNSDQIVADCRRLEIFYIAEDLTIYYIPKEKSPIRYDRNLIFQFSLNVIDQVNKIKNI